MIAIAALKANRRTHLLATLLLCTSVVGQAHAGELNGYKMSIHAKVPGSKHLQTGDHRKAIAASRSVLNQPGWKNAAQNNLCVSYTILGEYQRAERACLKAVNSLLAVNARQRRQTHGRNTNLAMAYSNRGVLRALSDDFDGASQDFIKAKKYAPDAKRYTHNPALLQWNRSIDSPRLRISAN